MNKRYCIDLKTPAKGFMDSFLLGNGRLGSTVRSGVGEERININLDRFWSGGPQQAIDTASPAHLLPELRRAIRGREHARADEISSEMQGQGWTQSYQPLSGLRFRFEVADERSVTDYRRRLDLSTATAEHHYVSNGGTTRVISFVSSPQNVAVTAVRGEAMLPVSEMQLSWDCPHPSTSHSWIEGDVRWTRVVGRAPARVIPLYVSDGNPVSYSEDPPGQNGLVPTGMGFSVVAALLPIDGGAQLVVAAECGYRGSFQRPTADVGELSRRAQLTVHKALLLSPDELHRENVNDYRHYFERNDLRLPDRPGLAAANPAKAELLYHFGRYLLISSSRAGTEPANLQGIWNPYRRPAWSSNHTLNINTEMNYWPSLVTGLGDLAEPLIAMIEELVEAGKETARHFYAAPGSVAHHNSDLWRFSRPVKGLPMWSNWTAALPWLMSHCWDHWEYGAGDENFARDRLLPMMVEVTRFALFMLVDDADGCLVVSPSSSPEHCFLVQDGTTYGVTEGSTLDQVLYRQHLERFVTLAAQLGEESDLASEASAALARLRQPPVSEDGTLGEWAEGYQGAEPGHRHFSHLYGLFPGSSMTWHADRALSQAARKSLEDRLTHSKHGPGWSHAWVICLAARLRDSNLARHALEVLLTGLTTNSLLVLHPYEGVPDNSVFQIDGNFGATAGILEMLLQSVNGIISLLPALPDAWASGSLAGGRVRGGHVVDLSWEVGALTSAIVRAGRSTNVTLDVPSENSLRVTRVSDGSRCAVVVAGSPMKGRQHLTWPATEGETYSISPLSEA